MNDDLNQTAEFEPQQIASADIPNRAKYLGERTYMVKDQKMVPTRGKTEPLCMSYRSAREK
ncbi:hypothetical protein GF319_13205 [Candidatus Bathyarchaeota archaeon]|nr:hypothetical protein [Candidatus Bathyarchaeota archaeon]